MWNEIKKPLLSFIAILVILYSGFSYLTYQSIRTKEVKIAEMEKEVHATLEKNGELSFNDKKKYNSEVDIYVRSQGLLQSFWLKWIFDFEEYEKLD